MIEFAIVLLIKRAKEFQRKKKEKMNLNFNRKEPLDTRSLKEGQNQLLLKENKSKTDENHEGRNDILCNFSNEKYEKEILYSTTDVIDFVSLFVFLICYITFNCVYMRIYIS